MRPAKRTEVIEVKPKRGKPTEKTVYVYDETQPCGRFLGDKYPDGDGLWLKLWREMLWAVPRGRPKAREPYDQRADGTTCKEGPNAWANLLKTHKARAKNGFHTAEVSSALWPGAQAVNAEGVAFEGRAEHNLLLHFWPLAVLLFVPQKVEADGSSDFAGYTLAVPEVSHLRRFTRLYPRLLQGLPTDARGYRPAGAVIDLPAEGGLAFLDHMAAVAAAKVEGDEAHDLKEAMAGVEYLHLVKAGDNVKLMAAGRVAADVTLMAGYREIVHPNVANGQPVYRNPLFRRGLLEAVLGGDFTPDRWHRPFARPLAEFEPAVFLRPPRQTDEADDLTGPPAFATDAGRRLADRAKRHLAALQEYDAMPEPDRGAAPRPDPELPVIVNKVVRTYLQALTEARPGCSLKPYRDEQDRVRWDDIPRDVLGRFNAEKRKVGESLFMDFRSRRDRAFVDLFATRFFTAKQYLPDDDRLKLANVLIAADAEQDWDDLKTLTLLSLSANS